MKLENLPYREFITLDTDAVLLYLAAIKLGKFPKVDRFNIGDIYSAPWGFVKDVQEEYSFKGLTYAFVLETVIEYGFTTPEKAYKMGIFHIQEFLTWLAAGIDGVCNLEKQKLSLGRVRSEEYDAGIEDLNAFRTFPQTDALALGDPLKYEDVRRKLKYYDAFLKLAYNAALNNYKRELSRIVNNKH